MKARSGKYLAVHLRGVKPARTGRFISRLVILPDYQGETRSDGAVQGLESKSVFFKQCIKLTAFLQVIDEQFRKLSNGGFIRS